MKKRNQIISSLMAIAITTSITNTCAYAKDERTNDEINTKNYSNELDKDTLELDPVKVTTGAAAFIDTVEDNKVDEIVEQNDEELITLENITLTLDEYLKSKMPKNSRRVKRSSSFSLFESNKEKIKERIKSGIENYETNIDIKDLVDLDDIQSNSNKILKFYFDVVYENPQFFYCSPTNVNVGNCTFNSYGKLNSCDIQITYEYSNNVIDKMKDELNSKINDIKQNYLDKCSTNLEKEYAIHDYITQNCTYDKDNYDKNTIPNISHTSYGSLINQIAVCDGYSKAAMLLLNEYGIEAGIVTNDNHAWNYVNIDGDYYQTDLTWDDPTPESNKITYKNFNCSDNVMHKIHPWTSTIPGSCTDTTFDDLFRIVSGNSVIEKNSVRIKDKLYYLSGTDLWTCNLDGNNKVLFSKNITKNNNMVNLVAHNKDIYYLSELEIKKINIDDKQIESFKNLSTEFNFIFGTYSAKFYIKDNKLNISFGQGKDGNNLKYSTKDYELNSTNDIYTDIDNSKEKPQEKPKEVIKPNKLDLQNLYNDNKDKFKDNYTDDTWDAFVNSLNDAKNILDRDDITQDDLDNSLAHLQTAINNLQKKPEEKPQEKPEEVIKPSKLDLQNLYNDNKDKIKGTYTDDTWDAFVNSLNDAKNILDRDDITQDDLDNSLAHLQTAINNLQKKPEEKPQEKPEEVIKPSKLDLQNLYNDNKDKIKGTYTDDTWDAFVNSLNDAKNILDRDDITQGDLDSSLAHLQTAINNLQEKPEEKPQEKPEEVIKPNKKIPSSSGGGSRGGSSRGGGSTGKSSENKTVITNEKNTNINTTKINANDSSNLNIVSSVKNVAKTLTGINNINKEISLDEIYEINNGDLNGTIANLKSDNNKYIYISCRNTTENTNINSIKIDASKLNSKEKYIYNLDNVTNKLILINTAQDDSIEIQANNQAQYILSNMEMQSFKNNDWNKINDNWLYVENGRAVTGWVKTLDNKWYHMDNQGIMQKGWIQDNNKWYHLSNGGNMDTGWFKETDGNWYYLNSDGSMKTGWFKDVNGNWYYLKSNGSMAVDTKINGYYVSKNGLWE